MPVKRLFTLAATLLAGTALAQLPDGFADTLVAGQLSSPTAIAFDPIGRLFICHKQGMIRLYTEGTTINYDTIAVSSGSERGLLGIAFDPDLANHPYMYLYYTTSEFSLNPPATPKNRVSRFTIGMNELVDGSEVILLDNIPSDAGNHNAGCLRFGQDGLLYISTGDGGQSSANSQSLSNLAGKILRINRNGGIPSTNPFVGTPGARGEIFAYGLRNPFRFSIRPNTNTLFIGDVGQSAFEEVNVAFGGENFGWPSHEGPSNQAGFTSPLFSYAHTQEQRATITGGCFLTKGGFPAAYNGDYFYGDYVRSIIGRLEISANNALQSSSIFVSAPTPVDFAEGNDAALYYVSIWNGEVRKIAYTAPFTSLNILATEVPQGTDTTATVTLGRAAPAAGEAIQLESSNHDAAAVPPAVTVASGQTTATFTVDTKPVTTNTTVTISGTAREVTRSDTLLVRSSLLQGVSLRPQDVKGGGPSVGTVTLGSPAPSGGTVVGLSNNGGGTIAHASQVTVPAGSTSVNFHVRTFPTSVQKAITVTGQHSGASRSGVINVYPEVLTGFTANPTNLPGGNTSQGTLTLSGPAPAAGQAVSLTSNSGWITVPATVTVQAGSSTRAFNISTYPINATSTRSVTAAMGTIKRTVFLTLGASNLASLSLSPTTVKGGATSTGTITLAGPAPSVGGPVALNTNSSSVQVPANFSVGAGQTTGQFQVQTFPVRATYVRQVIASRLESTRTANITLTP